MKVIIESPFDLKESDRKEIEDAISDLSKFQPKMTKVGVFFKLDDGNLPDAVTAEVQVHVPGPVIFASDTAEQYWDAFNSALKKAENSSEKQKK